MLFLPSNRWVWILWAFSTNSPLASFLWLSHSIRSKMFQWLAVLFQLQGFRLGKLKSLLAILVMARVHGRGSQYSPSISFTSRTGQSDCKAILKKSLMQHWVLGEKYFAFPLLVCIMVMTGYTIFNHFGHMVVCITEYPWKHLQGAWVQVLQHRSQSTLWSA